MADQTINILPFGPDGVTVKEDGIDYCSQSGSQSDGTNHIFRIAEDDTGPCTVVDLAPFPVADFSSDVVACQGVSVSFTDESDYAQSWYWQFGDGYTSEDQNPSHTYASYGTFDVSLTVGNVAGEDTETKTDHITVYRTITSAVINFTASPVSGAMPLSVRFYYSGPTLRPGFSIRWQFGDGTEVTRTSTASFLHSYTSAGTYSVTMTVTSTCGTASKTRSNYITVADPYAWHEKTSDTYWDVFRYTNVGDSSPADEMSWGPLWESYSAHQKWRMETVGSWANGYRPSKVRLHIYGNLTWLKIYDTTGAEIGSWSGADNWDTYCGDGTHYTSDISLSYGSADIGSIELRADAGGGSWDSIYGAVCKVEFWS